MTFPVRKRWILFGVAVALLAAVFFSPLREWYLIATGGVAIEEWKAERIRQTTGTDLVSVKIHGHNFLIPRNFFKSPYSPNDKALLLWFLWPDVEPYSPERHFEFWKAVGDESRMVMVLTSSARGLHSPEDLLYAISRDYLDETKSPWPYDFGLFQWPRNEEYASFASDIYSSSPSRKIDTLIRCTPEKPKRYPQCSLLKIYSSNMKVKISFPKKFLSDWEEIEERVLSLFASWNYDHLGESALPNITLEEMGGKPQ